MGLDYDLYVIDPTNHDTSMYQLRDCLKDAIDELAKRTASLSERLNKLENESDAADNNALNKEPYIKDEKVRKALRNYAEVFNWKSARYSSVNNAFVNQGDMFFVRSSGELEQLEQLGYIPIDELCGVDDD